MTLTKIATRVGTYFPLSRNAIVQKPRSAVAMQTEVRDLLRFVLLSKFVLDTFHSNKTELFQLKVRVNGRLIYFFDYAKFGAIDL